MKVDYVGDVDVRLGRDDLQRVLDGKRISNRAFGVYSRRNIVVNVFGSDDKFSSSGCVGEGFGRDFFQGWILEAPEEVTQLAFPWGRVCRYLNYNVLNIRMSRPAIAELLSNEKILSENEGYFCGIARGVGSGHIIDRLNLRISIPQ